MKISMLIPDEDLALIDAVAVPNRTAFMIKAAKEAALRVQREREDQEIARICTENAERDRALAEEFAAADADGL